MNRLSLCFAALSTGLIQLTSAAPVANPDNYEQLEDASLAVAANIGVLLNDSAGATAVLQSGVSNGTLEFEADGSFVYIPDENFSGSDSFTYVAEELPDTLTFTVDRSRSTVDLDATVNVGGFSLSDSDDSSVTGDLLVQLTPPGAPFDRVHILDANLVLADDVGLDFSVPFLLSVDVSADAGDLSITMTSPGAAGTANGAGEFSQLMNDFAVAGVMDVQASGIVDLGVPNGPVDVGSTLDDVDLDGTISESGGTITLTMPVTFVGTFPIGENTVDIEIEGTLVATAPAPAPEQSAPVTVTIDVDPVNDAPLVLGESYYVFDGQALASPAVPAGGGSVLVAAGGMWSYLDDGSDAGTGWREPGFDDSSWAVGAAELGYGDGDEATEVEFGGDVENRFVTTYFRREFDIAALDQNAGLLLRLKRDDGAAVYLNGVEIVRDNLPAGAGFDTLAIENAADDGSTFIETSIHPSALLVGTNTIAVEVHQAEITSSDLSFDLELIQLPLAGLLANDSDLEGDMLSASLAVPPSNGEVVVSADGSFSYTPDPGFMGVDPFVYVVTDGRAAVSVELVPSNASWQFLDDGSDQGIAWRTTEFDDSGWSQGAAQLGYGEGDEATVVSFGGVDTNKHETTYFRHRFYVGDPAAVEGMVFRLLRDDAAAVYLNGNEVFRDTTLSTDAAFDTLATAAVDEEAAEISVSVSPADLIVGQNVIAVEVHQSSISSTDLSFALSLAANVPAPAVVMARGAEWSYLDDGSDQATDWRGSAFDATGWSSGPSPLGYGADEATTVGFGGDANAKFATTYFRKSFEVASPEEAVAARIRVRRDDGTAIYLNGVEIVRNNLDAGASAGDFAQDTAADSDRYLEFGFDPSLLSEGTNVLAAEVHQVSPTSSDIIFDAELAISVAQIKRVATIDVISPSADPDSDNDGMLDSYELANGLTVGIDDSAGDLDSDGQSNLSESIAGTIANDPKSALRLRSVSEASPGMLEITVATVAGKSYRLQTSDGGEAWADVAGSDWTADAESSSVMTPTLGESALWRALVVVPSMGLR